MMISGIRTAFILVVVAICWSSQNGKYAEAATIEFDYSHDRLGFFDDPARREVLEWAAEHVNRYIDRLEPIIPVVGIPEGQHSWFSLPPMPPSSADVFLFDMTIPENTLRVFVGGNNILPELQLATTTVKEAAFLQGPPEFEANLTSRGQEGVFDTPATDFSPWGASMQFNSDPRDVSWHFGLTTEELEPDQTDLLTVAMHELMHVFGFGALTAPSFDRHLTGLQFNGPEAKEQGSFTNPDLLLHDGGHWKQNTIGIVGKKGQPAIMEPIIPPGERRFPTKLDHAAIRDVGWEQAMPGDSNLDRQFDTADIIVVSQGAKYRTGEVASWNEGDWNDDLLFDQNDLIDALSVDLYLTGPYAARAGNHEPSEEEVFIEYDPDNGDLRIQASAGIELTSFSLESESSILLGQPHGVLSGPFDVSTNDLIFKATLGGTFDTLQLSHAVSSGLSENTLLNDLSISGSLAGGGHLTDFTLVFVPEPHSLFLSVVALAMSFWYISGSKRGIV